MLNIDCFNLKFKTLRLSYILSYEFNSNFSL